MADFQEISEVSASLEEIYMRGRVDINFFASLCIPEVCIFDLPDFYCACFQLLVNRKEVDVGKLLRFALGLPRGHAKTTFIKILIVWLIVYDQAKFILIVCANAPLAELLLSDIHDIRWIYRTSVKHFSHTIHVHNRSICNNFNSLFAILLF